MCSCGGAANPLAGLTAEARVELEKQTQAMAEAAIAAAEELTRNAISNAGGQ